MPSTNGDAASCFTCGCRFGAAAGGEGGNGVFEIAHPQAQHAPSGQPLHKFGIQNSVTSCITGSLLTDFESQQSVRVSAMPQHDPALPAVGLATKPVTMNNSAKSRGSHFITEAGIVTGTPPHWKGFSLRVYSERSSVPREAYRTVLCPP